MNRLVPFLALILLVSLISPTALKADAATIEKLGTPHYSIAILSSAYGTGPNGEEAIFSIANGSPAVLNIIDAKTGNKISAHPLPGASQAWGAVTDPFGNVYIAGGANLYQYHPDKDQVENLGKAVSTESTLWHIKSDEEGRIYGGTFPNGKLFMYDPAAKKFTDYGPMAEGEQYSRSLDLYKGDVYVGMGAHAHLIKFDPATQEKEELPLPEAYQNEKFVYDLDIVKHYMFARVTDSGTLLVYDLKRKKWIDEITGVKGLKVSPAGRKNLIYFNKDNEIHSYNPKNQKLTPTGFKNSWSNRGFGWIHLDEQGFKGPSLVSMLFNGTYWVFNPKSGQSKIMQAQMEGQPISIQSIGVGPEGNIYTSGYLSGGFAQYSAADNKLTSFSGFGQAENMIATNKYLYLGVYTGGVIYQYDPDLPYDLDAGNTNEATNPKKLFELKGYEQDRPFGVAQGDGKVFFGTVPTYGKLGGALTILNEESGAYEVFRNVVENQSVIALQYKDGLVYGATSVSGGLGITPTETEAKLFIFDPVKKEKIFETTPLSGEKAIGTLAFDPDGNLWGMSPGKIFKFNTQTREVIQSKELFPFSWSGVGHYWRGAFLDYDADGSFYGTTLGRLFRFNPLTWEVEVLNNDASLYAKDRNGNFYFSRGTDLYRYVR
jgi:hypothetical protein